MRQLDETTCGSRKSTIVQRKTQRFCETLPLLEHLIRQDEERRGKGDPKRLSRLEVEDQLEFRGLLYREVRGLGPLQDFVHVDGNSLGCLNAVWPIGDQPPSFHILFPPKDAWELMLRGERGNLLPLTHGDPTGKHD